MQKKFKKLLSLALVCAMMLSMTTTAFATNSTLNVSNNEIFESYNTEYGTIYLEENSDYRLAYIVYNDGHVQYSVTYNNNPYVSHTGNYNNANAGTSRRIQQSHDSMVDILLALEAEKVVNFKARPQSRVTILTESDAVNFASRNATGWKAPTNSKQLGSYSSGGITAKIYESVNGVASEESVLNYYAQDTLVSILSAVKGFSISTLTKVISNIVNAAGEAIAQKNGTLTYFSVDNTRTKSSRIDGQTYYWAGWDVTYAVYSGDKKTFVERTYNFAHSDYNYDNAYFGQTAIDNYNNSY